MRTHSLLTRYAYAAMTSIMLLGLGTAAKAQDLPSFMAPIAGRTASSHAETATKNVLALNTMMFELYDDAARVFQANLLSKHPVILGLFSGACGRFILYRPGMAPLEAPSVPIVYQLLKSVGHSTMALTEIVMPHLDNAADQSWRSSMAAYRAVGDDAGERCEHIGGRRRERDGLDQHQPIIDRDHLVHDDARRYAHI